MSDQGIITLAESQRLILLEGKIAKGISAFIEVGEALAAVRDERLYRIEYGTFEDYCREKWGMSKTQANRLISSSEVVAVLAPIGAIPATESQVRPLTKLEPVQQVEAWGRAQELAGDKPVTARHVEEAVLEVLPPKPERINYKPSNGMEYAEMAILNLEKIQPNDTERTAAFERIAKWINKHSN